MTGFLLLHRKLADSQIWGLQEPFCYRAAWVDLLLRVVFAPTSYRGISLTPGEFACGLKEIAERYGWDEVKLLAFLRFLRDNGMIRFNILAGASGRIVKLQILRWQEYQFGSKEDEKKRSKRKAEETEKQDKKQDIEVSCYSESSPTTLLDKNNSEFGNEEQDTKRQDIEKQDKEQDTNKIDNNGFVRAELDVSEFTPSMKAAYQKWKENGKNENTET